MLGRFCSVRIVRGSVQGDARLNQGCLIFAVLVRWCGVPVPLDSEADLVLGRLRTSAERTCRVVVRILYQAPGRVLVVKNIRWPRQAAEARVGI